MAPLICTTPMCSQGKASVDTMSRTYNLLVQNPGFDRWRFESTVVSLEEAFDAAYSFYDPMIPFNPKCCAILDIGYQADRVTADMRASVGAAPTGPGPSTQPGVSGDSLVTRGIVAAVALSAGNVAPLIRKRS